MERMNNFVRLSAVVILNCLPLLCYSNNNNDYYNNLPEQSIVSIGNTFSDYTQLIFELPDGQSDTIWTEAQNIAHTINFIDGRREVLQSNTITSPQIEFNSQDYAQESDGGFTLRFKSARYPKDAIDSGKSGKVFSTCIVEKDGSLSNIIIKNSVWPSIDQEAYRLLSKMKLIPCKFGDKTFRCRQNIALSFKLSIKEGTTLGKVCLAYAINPPSGISERYQNSVTTNIKNSNGPFIKKLLASIDIDIPQNNKNLEALLCKVLFKSEGALKETADRCITHFKGKCHYEELNRKGANNLVISAHANGFKKDLYYSYSYTIELNTLDVFREEFTSKNSLTHSFIYSIPENRILTVPDMFSQSYLNKLSSDIGISDLSSLEMGMNNYFLYIGTEGEALITLGLCQENWEIFSPMMQTFLGNKASLPLTLDQNVFDYDQEPNYETEVVEKEDGSSSIIAKTYGYKNKKEGIQLVGIREKMIRKPCIGNLETPFYEYLTELWKKNEILPDSDGFVANISFVVNKNQTMSNLQTKLISGDENFYNKFIKLFNNTPKWKPMIFAVSGPAKSYFNYNLELGGIVHEFVDQMPNYPGGLQALYKWISKEITIPTDIPEDALKARLFVKCIVERDGSVSNVEVMNGTDNSLKEELERVLANMPNWNPGKKLGKEVRVKTSFPLRINITR